LQTEFENTENKQIMYAIVDIAGQQFKVEKEQKLFVHRLEGDAGSKVSFDKVLLIENDGKITFGNPVIKDAAISAKVIEHVKGDKVLVFKKKRRKGYKKLNGHRQFMTRNEITAIDEKAAKQPAAKASEKKEAPTSAADKKPETKAATAKASAAKTDAARKPAEKKAPSAEKKTTASKTSAAKKPAASKTATEKAPAAKKPAAEKKATATKKPAAKKPAAKKSSGEDKTAEKE
jgi:large subunit ribosomal protein L21